MTDDRFEAPSIAAISCALGLTAGPFARTACGWQGGPCCRGPFRAPRALNDWVGRRSSFRAASGAAVPASARLRRDCSRLLHQPPLPQLTGSVGWSLEVGGLVAAGASPRWR